MRNERRVRTGFVHGLIKYLDSAQQAPALTMWARTTLLPQVNIEAHGGLCLDGSGLIRRFVYFHVNLDGVDFHCSTHPP